MEENIEGLVREMDTNTLRCYIHDLYKLWFDGKYLDLSQTNENIVSDLTIAMSVLKQRSKK